MLDRKQRWKLFNNHKSKSREQDVRSDTSCAACLEFRLFHVKSQLEISIANNAISKQWKNLYRCGRFLLTIITQQIKNARPSLFVKQIGDAVASENLVLASEIRPVTSHLACERRRISGCRDSLRRKMNLDSRKYVCVRRLLAIWLVSWKVNLESWNLTMNCNDVFQRI